MRGAGPHDDGDGDRRRPGRFDDPDPGTGAGGGRAGAGPAPSAGRPAAERPAPGRPPRPRTAPRSATDDPSGPGHTSDPAHGTDPDPAADDTARDDTTRDDTTGDDTTGDAPDGLALPAGLLAGGILDGLLGARADPPPDETPGADPVPSRPAARGRRAANPRDDARIDDLAHRAAAGDRAALHELLRLVDPLVVRYCRGHLGGTRIGLAGPDDVAQEVMVAVCKALPAFDRSRSVFMAFVYGIAGNKIADAFRAAARDRSVSTDELPEGVDLAGGPEAEALRDDAARRIGALLARLSDSARTILVYRLALNYSAEETAELVTMTPGAVRVAQHRALQKLRDWIADDPP